MHPILFKIGPVCVYSYGFMIAVAFSVGMYLAIRAAKEAKINPDFIVNLVSLLLFSGIIGARLLYVALNIREYIQDPLEILMLSHGGLSIFGGLFFATSLGVVYVKKNGYSVSKIGDLLIPYVALGQAIGRIGCFLNGCCFGRPTDSIFGVVFPGGSQPLHPTQVYSSMAMIFLYGFLRLLQKLQLKDGVVVISYGLCYSIGRFFMEFLRGDNAVILFGLTFSQFVSVLVFVGCSALLWKNLISKPAQKI
jgi:phosphatidylglycerol:prolipoprotein diacylglycerol transferase